MNTVIIDIVIHNIGVVKLWINIIVIFIIPYSFIIWYINTSLLDAYTNGVEGALVEKINYKNWKHYEIENICYGSTITLTDIIEEKKK